MHNKISAKLTIKIFHKIFIIKHNLFLRFILTLEKEVYSDDSPMWDPEFKAIKPPHLLSKKLAKQ